ncbi:hypothetical protein SynRCC2555_02931 [Synechococcus sp. WH 8101]|nr:hypothetical protein SynRCC2555_02931 [Synechococcus sp. WH 8101]
MAIDDFRQKARPTLTFSRIVQPTLRALHVELQTIQGLIRPGVLS